MKTPQNFRNLVLLAMLSVFAFSCKQIANEVEKAEVNITYELPVDVKPNASQTELAILLGKNSSL